jgi:phosphoribosylamine--glycine ligase
MRILVIGGGAREHALCWRLRREGAEVFAAPGSDGIATVAARVPLHDPADVAAWAAGAAVDLAVVGPEQPLAAGVADRLRARGVPVCGPSQAAARLEASKAWCRAFCARHGIPGPRFTVVEHLPEELPLPCVVKTDGLAAGKGVVVVREPADLERARRLPPPLVIEELLLGRELSVFALVDGRRWLLLGDARDYKRLLPGDRGPNTGGMGAFSPVGEADLAAIAEQVLAPAVAGLRAEGTPFVGFLYAGLMLTAEGPRLLEFNVRLGDPEAQVLLPRWQDPVAEVLLAAARGSLGAASVRLAPETAVGIVLASPGYPDAPRPGQRLPDPEAAGGLVFHAATERRDGAWFSAGGRVLTAVGLGPDRPAARARALELARRLAFPGAQWREDVAG